MSPQSHQEFERLMIKDTKICFYDVTLKRQTLIFPLKVTNKAYILGSILFINLTKLKAYLPGLSPEV